MKIFKWYVCPHCGKNLFKMSDDAVIQGIKVYCKRCKEEIEININRAKEPAIKQEETRL